MKNIGNQFASERESGVSVGGKGCIQEDGLSPTQATFCSLWVKPHPSIHPAPTPSSSLFLSPQPSLRPNPTSSRPFSLPFPLRFLVHIYQRLVERLTSHGPPLFLHPQPPSLSFLFHLVGSATRVRLQTNRFDFPSLFDRLFLCLSRRSRLLRLRCRRPPTDHPLESPSNISIKSVAGSPSIN